MGGWYQVVKTIKGHRYLYLQQTFREGAHVRTRNRYLGPAGTGAGTVSSSSSSRTPLFQSPSDFSGAMLKQFDAEQWGKSAGEQLFGQGGRKRTGRRKTSQPVTNTDFKAGLSVTQRLVPDEKLSKAIRQGELGKRGAYFSIPGGSTYYDLENPNATPYNLAALRIADTTHKETTLQILQEALSHKSNTSQDIARLKGLIKFNQENGGFLAYMDYDEIPGISSAAKTLGYDGIAVVENDDLPGDASSINVWNLNKIEAPHRNFVTTTSASWRPASPELPEEQANRAGAPAVRFPRDVQAEITDTIIEAIESGRDNGKWEMPWHAISRTGMPINVVTHEPYHGVNVLMLSLHAMKHKWPNQWGSFAQWKEKGASVRKGEHGVPIVFYSQVQVHDVEETEGGNTQVAVRTIPVFRYSTVFNIAQVDNPPKVTTTPTDLVNPIEKVEQYISATKADIRFGGNSAYFSPGQDFIQIPPREAFTGSKTSSPTEAFYSTILHELCHWSGGKNRLKRDIANRFGDEAYAAEELVAEIGAAFACATLGITPELRPDHVQYVSSWLKILKEDKRAIFTAASAAGRAVEYLDTLQSNVRRDNWIKDILSNDESQPMRK